MGKYRRWPATHRCGLIAYPAGASRSGGDPTRTERRDTYGENVVEQVARVEVHVAVGGALAAAGHGLGVDGLLLDGHRDGLVHGYLYRHLDGLVDRHLDGHLDRDRLVDGLVHGHGLDGHRRLAAAVARHGAAASAAEVHVHALVAVEVGGNLGLGETASMW